jgi:hypothetical protein
MERLIYCPSKDNIDEAEKLASESFLPISVGLSKKLENIDFDTSKVQVLHIPELRNMFFLSNKIKFGFHQVVFYLNDFSNTYGTCELKYNGVTIAPLYSESHRVRWVFVTDLLGENVVEIYQDGKSLFLEKFDVHS